MFPEDDLIPILPAADDESAAEVKTGGAQVGLQGEVPTASASFSESGPASAPSSFAGVDIVELLPDFGESGEELDLAQLLEAPDAEDESAELALPVIGGDDQSVTTFTLALPSSLADPDVAGGGSIL